MQGKNSYRKSCGYFREKFGTPTLTYNLESTSSADSTREKHGVGSNQFENLLNQLIADEHPGDKIPQVGLDVYKVRLPNPSAQRGKSGDFRVVYYIQVVDRVALLTIYSKTEQTDISSEEIRRIVAELLPPKDDESDDTP